MRSRPKRIVLIAAFLGFLAAWGAVLALLSTFALIVGAWNTYRSLYLGAILAGSFLAGLSYRAASLVWAQSPRASRVVRLIWVSWIPVAILFSKLDPASSEGITAIGVLGNVALWIAFAFLLAYIIDRARVGAA